MFIHIINLPHQVSTDSPSFCNEAEARAVVGIIAGLLQVSRLVVLFSGLVIAFVKVVGGERY